MNDDETSDEASMGLRERKKRLTRVAMHRAALELVLEEGLSNVTADMIAARAGVSTRTFFNHWSTKESAILGILSGEGERLVESLHERIVRSGTRDALRSVLREALESTPADPSLRELKKQVMAREPKLHSISSGNLISVQTEMVDAMAEAFDGPDAHERAVITVQLGFALTRSAFAVSMARGIDLVTAFDEVVALHDAGRVPF
ncbi:TetR/AcrR family transcriptional regulator [Brachybacterium sp. GCM10030267]|uniref:TetR/AcrR family transcriptional regulator n=1 Tax=Brachybacterium sp. GCM10030267 TaxID=3273381 RepID=UPI00360AAFF8